MINFMLDSDVKMGFIDLAESYQTKKTNELPSEEHIKEQAEEEGVSVEELTLRVKEERFRKEMAESYSPGRYILDTIPVRGGIPGKIVRDMFFELLIILRDGFRAGVEKYSRM